VLVGEIDKGVGAIAGQLLNGARACMATRLKAVEQEELEARLEELEELVRSQQEAEGGRRWGA
jgi:hypothetical protein